MTITYLSHSGFLVELDHMVLLFDYYEGTIPSIPKNKPFFVFASHRHADHFNPVIFELAKNHSNIMFILSYDIWRKRVPEYLWEKTVHLEPNSVWEWSGMKVETLKSTDEGVAFLVEAEGKTFYHAGDLNDWRWEGEDKAWNEKMEKDFKAYIEPLRGRVIDAAFVPLDPRQEKNYTLGMDYFLELAEVKRVYPMHVWGDYTIINRWFLEHPAHSKKDRIVKITGGGEIFEQ